MSGNKMNARQVWTATTLALGLFMAPLALAGNTSQCDSVQDPMQRAQCRCNASMASYGEQTSSIIPQIADSNPYLLEVEKAKPGDNGSLGVPGLSQSCNAMTKDVFNSVLSKLKGFMGFDIGGLLGPIGNAAQGTVCQSINNAIMKRTTVACPRVAIPGFPINCTANLAMGSNGVQINGTGVVGGVGANGSSTTDLSGVTTANGSYNSGNPGGSVSGSTTIQNPAMSNTTPATGGASSSNGIIQNISCWISGNCQ